MKRTALLAMMVVLGSCNAGTEKQSAQPSEPPQAARRPPAPLRPDTVRLRTAHHETDTPAGEYLAEQLRPIRANFRQLNVRSRWDKVEQRDLYNSTEGGEARYYYAQGQPRKIVARHYGETFQQLTEYYLLPDGQLSFVFEKGYRYNRPMYYDAATASKNGDPEAFDLDKSEIEETRSYFERGRLIHQLSNQDCPAPMADNYLQAEQKRLRADFTDLLQTLKAPD